MDTRLLFYRKDMLRDAGVTQPPRTWDEWRDTLDPDRGWGGCDINLLTGQGVATGPEGDAGITVSGPAPAIWDWTEGEVPQRLPAECFG